MGLEDARPPHERGGRLPDIDAGALLEGSKCPEAGSASANLGFRAGLRAKVQGLDCSAVGFSHASHRGKAE